jgi:hypothetical protein
MYETWNILKNWYGATWHSLRLPCGTPSLDNLGKIGMDFRGVKPVTSNPSGERLGKAGIPSYP